MNEMLIPVSPGELLDKITILRIKAARIGDPQKIANVRLQLDLLEEVWRNSGAAEKVATEEQALQQVNDRLWDLEDRIRQKEAAQVFDAEFIALARGVYVHNDERAAIKARINTRLVSRIVEMKVYSGSGPAASPTKSSKIQHRP